MIIKAIGNSYSDIAYLNFNQNATPFFDSNFDAYKLFGIDEAPQVYTILPSINTKLSINVTDVINNNLSIPIGFKVGVAGNYKIKFENFSSFLPNVNFFLYDFKTTNVVNLRNSPDYSFTSSPNDIAERFVLSFVDPTYINELVDNDVSLSNENNKLYIYFGNIKSNINIKLFNMLGQQVKNITFKNTQKCFFDTNYLNGCYIIQINVDNKIYNKKVVIEG